MCTHLGLVSARAQESESAWVPELGLVWALEQGLVWALVLGSALAWVQVQA